MMTIFLDESGADGKNRYLVHGSILVRHPCIEPLRTTLTERLCGDVIRDELKWTNLSKRTKKRDLSAADAFFNTYETNGERSSPRFQALVVDQHKVNTKLFHDGDHDKCFYTFIYHLLLHRVHEMAQRGEDVHVILDRRSTRRYSLSELKGALRNGLKQLDPLNPPNIRSVEYRESHSDVLLQLTDFFTGAAGFCWNGHVQKPEASAAKVEAARWLFDRVGMDPFSPSARRDARFGVWPIRLSDAPKKKAAPRILAA